MGITVRKIAVSTSCILVLVIIYGVYVNTTKGEGFAIYLTRRDVPPSQMEALSHVDLMDQPVISLVDIITYNAQTHEIMLTPSAFDRVSGLDVPVSGCSFVVCVDKEPLYWGAFWTPISSLSFDGVTIWEPLNTQVKKVIVLELGYPSSSFYSGVDPRDNKKVLESLNKAGKLVTRLTSTMVDELPDSAKGYELYSWEDEGQWHFTLMTGTNRVKTLNEIMLDEDYISESGWVDIQVVGVDAVKSVLAKLPEGESVFWCDDLHIGQMMEQVNLQLPPKQIVDLIREHANICGLDFVVAVS